MSHADVTCTAWSLISHCESSITHKCTHTHTNTYTHKHTHTTTHTPHHTPRARTHTHTQLSELGPVQQSVSVHPRDQSGLETARPGRNSTHTHTHTHTHTLPLHHTPPP